MAKLSVIKKEFQIFWKNNPIITLDILYIKEKEILSGYISKINSTSQKKIILLMIQANKKKDGIILQLKNYLHY